MGGKNDKLTTETRRMENEKLKELLKAVKKQKHELKNKVLDKNLGTKIFC